MVDDKAYLAEYQKIMFFTISKVFWIIFSPENLVFLTLCIAALVSFARKPSWAIILLRFAVTVWVIFAVLPIGMIMSSQLESRFPSNPTLPRKVDGIIILGGVINPSLSSIHVEPQVNGSIERVLIGAELAHRFSDARVIFTGGSGDLFNPQLREAHYAPKLFKLLGLHDERVIFEDRARNTAQNAQITFDLAKPKASENWILVTSAFHMPRAVGSFRKAGWKIIPYPVDFITSGNEEFELTFQFNGISRFAGALHEYIGLLAYWLTGRTDTWFPGPGN